MIFNALVDFGAAVLGALMDIGNIFSLPLDLIDVLTSIIGYGSFILGGDLLLVCFSTFTIVMTMRLVWAIITFIVSCIPTMSPK